MLHRATSEQTFEEGSVVAVDLLELLSGGAAVCVPDARSADGVRYGWADGQQSFEGNR